MIHTTTPMDPRLGFAPWQLSGTVLGPLLNDAKALQDLGDAAHAAPYKAPPRAPVLYIKPRNTLMRSGAGVALPTDVEAYEIGASLALVVSRSACRIREADAWSFIAGWALVADLSVPHASYYRPSVRFKARDGSCLIGDAVQRDAIRDPGSALLRIAVDGEVVQEARMSGMLRPAARLLQDVTEFMTLHAGDVLLLGIAANAPRACAGQDFSIECDDVGRVQGSLLAQTEKVPQ